jgi:hypothetical protein
MREELDIWELPDKEEELDIGKLLNKKNAASQ